MEKKSIRVLAVTGAMGSGFKEKSLQIAMSQHPDIIGVDCGSTDPGPHFLGSGDTMFSEAAYYKELSLMLKAGRQAGVPVIVGSCGTAGTDNHVDMFVEMVKRIAKENSLHFKLGVVYSEQSKEYLVRKIQEGRIKPLSNAPEINEETIRNCKHIVGMAGVEPFTECFDNGADVIISGRCSDTSVYAALPLYRGFNPGPVWHAAKITECGAACVAQRKYPDCMVCTITDDDFVVCPPNPDYMCTPISVASHMLYENASPHEIIEPAGIMNCEHATYEAVDSRSVRVSGSTFTPASVYTIKLEGAQSAGFQSLFIGAIRDPYILDQLDTYLQGVRTEIENRISTVYGQEILGNIDMHFRVYGLDGAMGFLEPVRTPAHEVCVVIQITAATQELATALCKSASHIAIHYPIPEWSGLITSFALPYSPLVVDRGEVYRFALNHVVEPSSWKEMFRVSYQNI